MNITPDTAQNAIDMLVEAQEQLFDAIQTLRQVYMMTHDEGARHYIIAPIECAASDDHEWATNAENISKWIGELKEIVDNPEPDEEGDQEEPEGDQEEPLHDMDGGYYHSPEEHEYDQAAAEAELDWMITNNEELEDK